MTVRCGTSRRCVGMTWHSTHRESSQGEETRGVGLRGLVTMTHVRSTSHWRPKPNARRTSRENGALHDAVDGAQRLTDRPEVEGDEVGHAAPRLAARCEVQLHHGAHVGSAREVRRAERRREEVVQHDGLARGDGAVRRAAVVRAAELPDVRGLVVRLGPEVPHVGHPRRHGRRIEPVPRGDVGEDEHARVRVDEGLQRRPREAPRGVGRIDARGRGPEQRGEVGGVEGLGDALREDVLLQVQHDDFARVRAHEGDEVLQLLHQPPCPELAELVAHVRSAVGGGAVVGPQVDHEAADAGLELLPHPVVVVGRDEVALQRAEAVVSRREHHLVHAAVAVAVVAVAPRGRGPHLERRWDFARRLPQRVERDGQQHEHEDGDRHGEQQNRGDHGPALAVRAGHLRVRLARVALVVHARHGPRAPEDEQRDGAHDADDAHDADGGGVRPVLHVSHDAVERAVRRERVEGRVGRVGARGLDLVVAIGRVVAGLDGEDDGEGGGGQHDEQVQHAHRDAHRQHVDELGRDREHGRGGAAEGDSLEVRVQRILGVAVVQDDEQRRLQAHHDRVDVARHLHEGDEADQRAHRRAHPVRRLRGLAELPDAAAVGAPAAAEAEPPASAAFVPELERAREDVRGEGADEEEEDHQREA
mmetsp:Transcript_25825/g.79686  ORF Transcript_25825/g.79686 Transcript_25825/m.79686 type:complete len:646 (-) Transcript_25825:1997-3934(-)